MVKVSVLLPVYNTHPNHLRMAIDSVLAQSFTDFELLIFNDASTKPHVDTVVRTYKDPRITYVKNETNLGISKVRNKLIEAASGEYLAVMDHDDLWLPQKLQKQIDFMEKNPAIGVCGTGYKKFGQLLKRKTVVFPEKHAEIRASLFFRNVIHHPSCVMRRETVVKNNIRYDESYISVNDRKLFMDLTDVSEAYNFKDVLCKYRMHKNMTSKAKRKEIGNEQTLLRKDFLQRIGANLSESEEDTLNNFAFKGRTKIYTHEKLAEVEALLVKLAAANSQSLYFDKAVFDGLCAKYLLKRCQNAAFYGRISSKDILERTPLPVRGQKTPLLLKIINNLK